MTITIFGWIWFILMVICIFLPFRYSYGLLILSTIFQSSSVITIFDNGIYPMLITEAYIIFKFLLMQKSKKNIINEDCKKFINKMFVFLIVTSIISIISSYLFSNKIFYDRYSHVYFNISFDFSSVIRIVTLGCNILTIYVLYRTRNLYSNKFIIKAMLLSLALCLFIGVWEFTCKKTGYMNLFPYDLIYNNVSYKQAYNQSIHSGNVRMNSTFLEPSYFGCFLVANFFAILEINKNKKYLVLLILTLICLALNLSATGIVSFILMILYYLFIYKKFKVKKETLLLSPFFIICLLFILLTSGYLEKIINMISGKLSSVSGNIRLSADYTSMKVFINTYFLGGGWACYRGSSLIFSTLAQVGVIGIVLFFKPIYDFIKKLLLENVGDKYYNFGFIYLISILISMSLSIPDITFMLLWLPLYYLVSIKEKEELE